MQNLQKKPIAVLGMVVLMVLACIIGSSKALSKPYEAATQEYTASIRPEVDNMVTYAGRLVTVAGDYTDAKGEAKEVSELVEDAQKASAKADVAALGKAAAKLTDAVEALSAKLDSCSLSEQDAKYNRGYLADVRSCRQVLERIANEEGGYNELAGVYNRVLSNFPALIIGRLIGYSSLPLYS